MRVRPLSDGKPWPPSQSTRKQKQFSSAICLNRLGWGIVKLFLHHVSELLIFSSQPILIGRKNKKIIRMTSWKPQGGQHQGKKGHGKRKQTEAMTVHKLH